MRTYNGYFRNEPPVPFKVHQEIIQTAYNHLPEMDKYRVNDSVEALCAAVKDVGPQTAMEILAALGKLMNEKEPVNGTNGRAE